MAAVNEWNLPALTTLVVVDGGKCESDLIALMDHLVGWCSPDWAASKLLTDDEYIPFAEPDLNNEHTGFAIKPGCASRKIKSLPLLFSNLKGGECNE